MKRQQTVDLPQTSIKDFEPSEYYEMLATSTRIESLRPNQKNIQIRVIIVEKKDSIVTKDKNIISTFLVADETGSCLMNFFDIPGQSLSPGDIFYIEGGYTSIYKNKMLLYQGKQGLVVKIGKFLMHFVIEPNVSNQDWNLAKWKLNKALNPFLWRNIKTTGNSF